MAVTQNTYTGDGTTVLFSFTFPYLETTDIKVSVNGTNTTAYTLANATTIQFNTAPANGAAIRIYRQTDDTALAAAFYPGSAIRSADLNDNFTQNLYVTQESNRDATQAISTANSATTTANTALSNSSTAISTANTAASNASAAVNTANTASSNASAAVSTANTASSNASSAVSTANTAATNASTALSTANQALSTANTASTNASAAVTTANSASSAASSATSTANTAASNAASAVSTANAANTAAGNAVTTANSAATDAAAALSASTTASTNAAAAVSTANTASTNASAAVSTANTAATNASTALSTANTALSTANTASTNASNAVTTANSASSTASGAVTTANSANAKADQAIAAVANSINFQLKSNVAAIPASPANDTYIEVQDSTGLESFTPLTGKPAGFVGDSGLSVRLRYTSAGSTWNWLNYYANNSETRYLKLAGGTLTGNLTLAGAPSSTLHPATKGYVDGYVSAINGDITSLGSTKLDASTAASTYQTQAGMSSYLTTANASSTYLTQSNAASTYQTQAGMSSYLTTSAAGSTYAPLASPTFTGTPTGPSFTVTGSTVPTNGLYLPSAGSVAISTGGSGRLFVTSAGNVGVGISTPGGATSPGAKFEVVGGGIKVDSSSRKIGYFDDAGIYDGYMIPYNASGQTEITNTTSFGGILLKTGNSATERLRVTPAGLVGIGTSSPSANLHVAAAVSDPVLFSNTSGSAYNTAVWQNNNNLKMAVGIGGGSVGGGLSDVAYIGPISNIPLNIQTNNTARITVTAAGNVGIGTTSVNRALEVNANNGTNNSILPALRLKTGSVAGALGYGTGLEFTLQASNNSEFVSAKLESSYTDATNFAGDLRFSTANVGNNLAERLRIASTGAFGLSGANYGSAGQVLTSQGSGAAPQWATPAGGAWEYISTVTASNSASVAFTSGITSTYDVYMITLLYVVPATSGSLLYMRTSSNGGSSYDSGASDYDWTVNNLRTSDSYNAGADSARNASYMLIGERSFTNIAASSGGLGISGNIYMHNPSRSNYCFFTNSVAANIQTPNANSFYTANGFGVRKGTSPINAIQLYYHTGNIASGIFRLYGLKNS